MVGNGRKATRIERPAAETPVKKARPAPARDVAAMVESIVGCKWSMHVLAQVRAGVNRPGAMVRSTRGLTTKVLNERLRKMVRFGILERKVYPEVPPRVEYVFTRFGERFLRIVDEVERVQRELDGGMTGEPGTGSRHGGAETR